MQMLIKQSLNTQLLISFILSLKDFLTYECVLQITNEVRYSESLLTYHLSPDKQFSQLDVDVWDQCPNVMISSTEPRQTFERYEHFIKLWAKGMEERKYVIRFGEDQHEQFDAFFDSPALYFVVDLLILKEYDDKCELYTHKYIGNTNQSQIELVDVWFPNGTFQFGRELFPEKLLNVNGRILNVGAAKYIPLSDPVKMIGMETQFLLEYTKRFNYTLNFDKKEVRLGLLFPNKSATGFTKLMINDQIDLVSYGLYIQEHRTAFGAFSFPQTEISLTCIVPKPRLINEWTIVYILTKNTWLVIIFSYFVLGFMFNLILWRFKEKETNENKVSTYFMVFRIFVGQPRSEFMRGKDRLLLGTLLCCIIIIQTFFTSKLSSFITVPIYKDDINNLEDLAKSGIPWYTKYYDEIKTLETVKLEPLATLYKTFRNSTPEDAAEMMNAQGPKRFAYAINQSFNSKYYTIFDYFTLENLQHFKIIKDHIIKGQYTAFFVRRNSVLLPSINKYWSYVWQHGFSIRWEIDTMAGLEAKIQQYLWTSNKGNANARILKLNDLEGSFVIGTVGLGISAVVFCLEIFIYKVFKFRI